MTRRIPASEIYAHALASGVIVSINEVMGINSDDSRLLSRFACVIGAVLENATPTLSASLRDANIFNEFSLASV